MSARAISLITLTLACGTPTPGSTRSGLIEARTIDAGEHPATGVRVTRFRNLSYGLCSGTLIAPDVVLTAAHCVQPVVNVFDDTFLFEPEVDVRLIGVESSTLSIGVRGYAADPRYDLEDPGATADIGLVFLDRAVLDRGIAVIHHSGVEPTAGELVQKVGYGSAIHARNDDPYGDSFVIRKRALDFDILEVAGDYLVIDAGGEAAACYGDSGGPSLFEVSDGLEPSWRVVGVASRVTNGDCRGASIEARVGPRMGWIKSEMGLACSDGRRSAEGCRARTFPREPTRPAGEIERPTGEEVHELESEPQEVTGGSYAPVGCQHTGAPSLGLVLVLTGLSVGRLRLRRSR